MLDVDRRTGFKPRATAITIDGVLVWGLAFLARPFLGSLLGQAPVTATPGFDDSGLVTELMASVSVVGTLYPVIEGVTGRSPGKRLLGYRIAAEDGTPAGVGRLLARSAVKNLGNIVSLLALLVGIGLGFASFVNLVVAAGCFLVLGDNRQALHDLLLRTAVFRARDIDAAARAASAASTIRAPGATTSPWAGAKAAMSSEPVGDRPAHEKPAVAPASRATGGAATAGTPVESKRCPKCGLSETELGAVIGWYCKVCGWRESRG